MNGSTKAIGVVHDVDENEKILSIPYKASTIHCSLNSLAASILTTVMDVKCQCGTINFKTPTDQPKALYHCHCLECRKQSGSAFGTSAIFTSEGLIPFPEDFAEKLGSWTRRGEESGGLQDCLFCLKCGNRVIHRQRNKEGSEGGTLSIKAGCIEGLNWTGGIHIFTKTAVVPIPEGAEQYEGAPP